ncbi:MAG: hypothetical protein KGL55_00410 [Rhodospirillales bacterium]|nr:hypothetical protein [Rhodospirillales bacterium]
MAQFFKLSMDDGQAHIIPQSLGGGILPGAASPGELLGQIDGLLRDLESLKAEIASLHGWTSQGPLFREHPDA